MHDQLELGSIFLDFGVFKVFFTSFHCVPQDVPFIPIIQENLLKQFHFAQNKHAKIEFIYLCFTWAHTNALNV